MLKTEIALTFSTASQSQDFILGATSTFKDPINSICIKNKSFLFKCLVGWEWHFLRWLFSMSSSRIIQELKACCRVLTYIYCKHTCVHTFKHLNTAHPSCDKLTFGCIHKSANCIVVDLFLLLHMERYHFLHVNVWHMHTDAGWGMFWLLCGVSVLLIDRWYTAFSENVFTLRSFKL